MNLSIRVICSLFLLGAFLVPHRAMGFNYTPYDGEEGYQEITISGDTYFVAFHGNWNATAEEAMAGWKTRAAELCVAAGSRHFIELKHVFERVTRKDSSPLAFEPEDGTGRIQKAFFIFISIIIPGGSAGLGAFLTSATKQGHIRCLSDDKVPQALDPARLVDATKVIIEARARNWLRSEPAQKREQGGNLDHSATANPESIAAKPQAGTR